MQRSKCFFDEEIARKQRIALVIGAGRGIGKACALSLASKGARVAGTARTTGELDQLVDEIKVIEEFESGASPLGRRLLPEEVAAAVTFLATEAARAINGQLINACGGKVLS